MSMIDAPAAYPFAKVVHLESGRVVHGWYLGTAKSHGTEFFAVATIEEWTTSDEIASEVRMFATSAWVLDTPDEG